MKKIYFNTPIKNKEQTYEEIIEMNERNNHTTSNLLDFEYISKYYKVIAIDLN